MLEVNITVSSTGYRLFLFSSIPPFCQWTVLEVEEYKRMIPTKGSGPVLRSIWFF